MKSLNREKGVSLSLPSPVLTSIFTISVVAMNLLANKEINTGAQWLRLDCGILFSGLCFLSMDVIVHTSGVRVANRVSVFALITSLAVSLLFFVASALPGTWAESFTQTGVDEVVNTALNKTFRGTWYVIFGSSVAFLVSSVLNNVLSNALSTRISRAREKHSKAEKKNFFSFAISAYLSTLIAQFTDNIIFALIVSKVFFSWSYAQCLICAAAGAVFELFCEIVISPIGYRAYRAFSNARLVAEDR